MAGGAALPQGQLAVRTPSYSLASCTPWRQSTRICRVRDIAASLKWRPIQDLVNGLRESAAHLRKAAISTDADRLTLPPREATAVGLIVDELVMNCFKYAFPGERSGKISVSLRLYETSVLLTVSDDGIGCAPTAKEGMGTGLVALLAAQLGGTMERTEAMGGGCSVTVTFPLTPEMHHASHSGPTRNDGVGRFPPRTANGVLR
jgi:anti-sigma regulatory factor (Ser/Thr protein kinase)